MTGERQTWLGVNPVIWTNDDMPTLGDHNSLERCLREARDAGYVGIELGHKFPRDPEVLGGLLREHNLSLISGWYGGRLLDRGFEAELEAASDQIDLLVSLGCQVLVYAEVSGCVHGVRWQPLEARGRIHPDDFPSFGYELTAFAEAVRARGLSLAYHHHMGTVVQTLDELDLLLKSSGSDVGLTLDTGHIAFAGGDPAAVIREAGQRLFHVHLKDVRNSVLKAVASGPSSYLDAIVDGVFTVPGDGDLEFEPVMNALRDVDYRGWLVVEADQDPAFAEPAQFARMGADHIRSLAGKVGLTIHQPPAPHLVDGAREARGESAAHPGDP